MAFFDIFLSEEKKIAKNRHRLTSKDSQPEDREIAARWLVENGTPKAILAALSRFDMRLEHQLNDKEEKEFLYALLSSKGEAIVKPLRSWLRQCRHVGLPLRMYEEFTSEERTTKLVIKLLQKEFEKDNFKPLKKNALLVWLAGKKVDGAVEIASLLLGDFDEEVRCSAAEVLISQKDGVSEILEAAMTKEGEDSNRLRHRIAKAFADRGWSVSSPEKMKEVLPEGYTIREGRVVAV